MTADLHIHTTASDGRLTPWEVVTRASEKGLQFIAITDHDTIDGFISLQYLPTPTPLTIIPGIEFSTDLPHNEVHILGYFIDTTNETLKKQLAIIINDRITRVQRMVERLHQLGYSVSLARVNEIAGEAKAIGRPHVAKALVEAGYFTSIQDAFNGLLEKNGPAYIPHYKLSPGQVIELIHLAGGLAVLAHPGLVGSDAIVQEMIELGIDGVEAYHPSHDEEQTKTYLAYAEAHHIVVTGGSDFHAIPGRFPQDLGTFTVPDSIAVRLQQAVQERLDIKKA
ncbi:PHP domain-containing protein [Anaerospora sp.]|uniref:PHP domain-containing protein n=1 Tax=Anaerospora sp. TaxID=1960278 RepID=UPI002896CF3E|nr:PHP domain-containing protein [Anaerospora sp.]